ncbi:MAG TPA: phospholipid carrier-dependent glycosyltransferase [Actinomycetota bacterium]|nr:phospholipid carrier-dependent glycosyltransferase [Actinomycetota bacterium]
MDPLAPTLADELPVRGRRALRHRTRWYGRPAAVVFLVTALAAGLRFTQLGKPPTLYFDEVYYAKDACLLARYDYRDCGLRTPAEQTAGVHPPLGRWIIAGGEALFGNDPFGWRFASAVAGTLSVLLTSLLALRLFGSALWAGVAGLLLATEHLNFVQSRISMPDIVLALFVVAGFLFLTLDREWIERRTPEPEAPEEPPPFALPPDRPPSPLLRPWRLAAGVALGAATAVKWSGGPALAGALLLALGWEWSRRRRLGLPSPLWEAVRAEAFGLFLSFVVVPLAVYLGSYGAWLADHGFSLRAWWELQGRMASFSIHLRAPHPYQSRPWTWLLLKRPVAYFYQCRPEGAPDCRSAEIIGIGNPVVFWGSLLALPFTAVAWARRRDWRAGVPLTGFAAQYFPWYLAARTQFLFYMTPVTPFLVLADTYAVRALAEGRWRARGRPMRVLATAAVVLSVLSFVFFYPVLTAWPLPRIDWKARIWFPSWI